MDDSSSASTATEPPACRLPASTAVLAVLLLATETAAPTPTNPPAPATARLLTAAPSRVLRVPDATLTSPAMAMLPTDTPAWLAPPSCVTATPALTPAAPPSATAPALLSATVRSRLFTLSEPATRLCAPTVAEVRCFPDAPA